MTSKADLRARLTERLDRLSDSDLKQASQTICDRLFSLTVVANALALAFYVPIQKEVNLMPLAQQMQAQQKTILFPRYINDRDAYELASVSNINTDLVLGKFGIPEPGKQCPVWPAEDDSSRCVWFVPGVGFDHDGNRLGRGNGYYDRFLNTKHIIIGVANDCQIVESIPADPHDVKMDLVVTDHAIYANTGSPAE